MDGPTIKPDPDIKYMDDDFYEDTGELQMPQKGAEKDVWLTRVPKWLFAAISKWDDLADGKDDDVIQIGNVQAFLDQDRKGHLSKSMPIRMFLDPKWQAKSQLPSAFELQMTSASADTLGNTYIFTEKDLPGYKPNGVGPNKSSSSFGMGMQDPKARIQKRGRFRKAIPKQTALLGYATREYNATPLRTADYVRFESERNKQAIQGANTRTNIMTSQPDQYNTINLNKKFKSFISTSTKPKSQMNKAARIPKNELIDQLHKCFDQYAYWPMKTLKAQTEQPEAYLKECLGDIADLVKTGPFASCWKRKSMYADRDTQVEDIAPKAENEDEENEEMETVV